MEQLWSGQREERTCTRLIQVVVEIRVAGAQVASQDGGVRREDSRHVDMSSATDDQPDR